MVSLSGWDEATAGMRSGSSLGRPGTTYVGPVYTSRLHAQLSDHSLFFDLCRSRQLVLSAVGSRRPNAVISLRHVSLPLRHTR